MELLAPDRLLQNLGGDSSENQLRVPYAPNITGADLCGLEAGEVEDHSLHLFLRTNFKELRQEAAYELFELYHPDDFRVWDESTCDGLIFDMGRYTWTPRVSLWTKFPSATGRY